MRIAHVGNFKKDSSNGVNQCIYNIAINQVYLGHDVFVYSFDNVSSIAKEVIEGVNHIIFPSNKVGGFLLSREFKNYIVNNEDDIEIYHLHSVFLPQNNMIARCIKEPYIITPHGGYSKNCLNRNIFSYYKKMIYRILFERKYVDNAKKVQALNENEKKDLVNYCIDKNKIFIVPNGVNKANFEPKKNFNEPINIVFMGRLDKVHKGLDLLIDGFLSFVEKNDTIAKKVKLLIVGPDTHGHLNDLMKKVGKSSVKNNIEFRNRVSGKEKESLLKATDIFVHTSRWEGMPISLLEALSFGIPLLITNETNIGQYVEKYDAGIVVDLNVNSISNGIAKVLSLDINKTSRNSINLANNEFDWYKNTKKITDNYI